MNYTENYHLPQWEETDRIMRTDFNAAMAGIEAGLTERESQHSALAGELREADRQMEAALQAADAALGEKELAHILRLAYNHYSAVREVDPLPTQIGVFCQDAGKMETPPQGMELLEGALHINRSGSVPTPRAFFESFTEVSPLIQDKVAASANQPMVYTFSTTAPGTITNLHLVGSYSNLDPGTGSLPVPCRAELKNLSTGTVDYSGTLQAYLLNGGSGIIGRSVPCEIPFYSGFRYQFTLTPQVIRANVRAVLERESCQAVFRDGSASAYSIANLTQDLQVGEPSRGGLVVLRCMYGGASAKITLRWNGKTIPVHQSRVLTYKGNPRTQELIFMRNELLPETNSFTLTLQCGSHGEFFVYDWGAILF